MNFNKVDSVLFRAIALAMQSRNLYVVWLKGPQTCVLKVYNMVLGRHVLGSAKTLVTQNFEFNISDPCQQYEGLC